MRAKLVISRTGRSAVGWIRTLLTSDSESRMHRISQSFQDENWTSHVVVGAYLSCAVGFETGAGDESR